MGVEYLAPAAAWALEMGAAYLEEIIENKDDFADALELKPLERKRLDRQGPQAATRILHWRPNETTGTVPSVGANASTANNRVSQQPTQVQTVDLLGIDDA